MTDLINSYLQESLDSKKGLTIYLQGGSTVAGGVTRIHEDFVEIKSQRSSKTVILIDAIIALEFV
jgi:preprotein translocase subunit YajC